MIIQKIWQRKNKAILSLSNGLNYEIPLDVMYLHKIEAGKDIDEDKLSLLLRKSEEKNCFDSLLKLIRNKRTSTFEVKTKLLKNGFSVDIVDKSILKANEYRLIDDCEYAENLISSLQSRGYGKKKIISSLQNKKIPLEIIERLESKYSSEDELEEAKNVFEKKLRILSKINKDPNKTREKIYRYMLSKGFSYDTVSSVMKECLKKQEYK